MHREEVGGLVICTRLTLSEITLLNCAIAFSFIAACGCSKPQYEHGKDTLIITCIDTLSSDQIDDNYGFAEVNGLCFCPDSTLIVVDSKLCAVRRYSASGLYLRSYGAQGQGPGEFTEPMDAAVCQGQFLVVSDTRGLNTFDLETGSWLDMNEQYTRPVLLKLLGGTDSSFTALISRVVFDQEIPCRIAEYRSYDAFGNQNSSVFWTDSSEIDFNNSDYLRLCLEEPIAARDNAGNVYISASTESTVKILKYGPTGELLFDIEESFPQNNLTSDEKQQELNYYTGYTGSLGIEVSYTPPDAWLSVTALGVDSNSLIWARIGGVEPPTFRLYNQTGDLVRYARVVNPPARGRFLDVRVTPWGIAGFSFDPEEDYPSVFIFRIEE